MRIVSFLPSATEMVYALGLGDQLMGVTHECDFPAEATTKPVVVRGAIEIKGLTPQQIDESVSRSMKAGQSLYTVDERLLTEIAPDLILTQDLCRVCAPSGNEVGRVLRLLPKPPRILWLSPKSLSGIFENIRELGEATGRMETASNLVKQLQQRAHSISERTAGLARPRVFCMEWLEPPYNAGHWMAELVRLAGGIDGLAREGEDSVRLEWERILEYGPEVLILSPCGFRLSEVVRHAFLLSRYPAWESLPAVKNGRVVAVDANSYFARPGPRVVDGIELLAHIFHPRAIRWKGPSEAFRGLTRDQISGTRKGKRGVSVSAERIE